jgi:hypothetical protein
MADLITSLVPFLFVLAVTFGALDVSGVFKKRQVNVIISLAFAFFAISNQAVSAFINSVLPYAIMGFIAVFFLGFIASFLRKGSGGIDYTFLIIVMVLVAIFAANYSLDFLQNMFPGLSGQDFTAWIGLAVIAVIFYSVYKLWNKTGQGQ